MANSKNSGDELRDLLLVLRKRRWIVVATVVVMAGLALSLSLARPKEYTSAALVQVNPLDPNQQLAGYNYAFLAGMQNEVSVASSSQVAAMAQKSLAAAGEVPPAGGLNVTNPTDTTQLSFAYTSTSPPGSAQWANAYAHAYIQFRTQTAEAAYGEATQAFTDQLDHAQAQLAAKEAASVSATPEQQQALQSEINLLSSQVGSLQARIASIPVPSATATQLIGPASAASSPSSPKPMRNLVLAVILGLGFGIVLASLRERLDDRTAGKDDLETDIGAPVLAVVPTVLGWRKRNTTRLVARDEPRSPTAEAYRSVRTNLQFLAQTSDLRTVVITSANLGEGKSTTCANLAVTLAQGGAKVIVISCDLRKPRLHRFFELSNERGLADVLAGTATLRDVTQRADGVETLRVVASGPSPSDPAELLSSPAMAKTLASARANADFVVLDTPPTLAVSDTLALVRLVDGVLVVADAQRTRRSALVQVTEQILQVGGRIVGGIYNNFDPARAKLYRRHYGSYYYEPYGDSPTKHAQNGDDDIPAEHAAAEDLWS